jgi:hypothetical protein
MVVAPAALLEEGMGALLPQAVRDGLIDIGVACNDTVLAMDAALVEVHRAHCARDVLHSGPQRFAWRAQHVNDLVKGADAYHQRLTVILARVATLYAVYVSKVALQVVCGDTPRPCDGTVVLPSELIADAEQHLPAILFSGPRVTLSDQNDEVAAARDELFSIIEGSRRAGSAARYDNPAAAEHNARTFAGEMTDFAEAVLVYASTLAWALGVYTSADEPITS